MNIIFNVSKKEVQFPIIKDRPDLHKFENMLLRKKYIVISKKDNVSEDGKSSGNFVERLFLGLKGDNILSRRRYNDMG